MQGIPGFPAEDAHGYMKSDAKGDDFSIQSGKKMCKLQRPKAESNFMQSQTYKCCLKRNERLQENLERKRV